MAAPSVIPSLLEKHHDSLVAEWVAEQQAASRAGSLKDAELRQQCAEFLHLLRDAGRTSSLDDPSAKALEPMRELLAALSRTRGLAGFTPRRPRRSSSR